MSTKPTETEMFDGAEIHPPSVLAETSRYLLRACANVAANPLYPRWVRDAVRALPGTGPIEFSANLNMLRALVRGLLAARRWPEADAAIIRADGAAESSPAATGGEERRWRCPQCKSDQYLLILGQTWLTLSQSSEEACRNGDNNFETETADACHEWDENSAMDCAACGWYGTVAGAEYSVPTTG